MKEKWELGCRYTYVTKDECYKIATHVQELGYKIKLGESDTGLYYFEIIDPFKNTKT